MTMHEHYQELGAMAVVGELGEEEQQDLLKHLQTCAECQRAQGDFDALYSMLSDVADTEDGSTVPQGMTRRFVARARSVGIPLEPLPSESRSRTLIPWPFQLRGGHVFGIALVILFIVIGSFFLGSHFEARRSSDRHASAPSPQQVPTPVQENTPTVERDAALKEQVRNLEGQLRVASAELESKRKAMASAKAETDSLTARIAELEASNSALKEGEVSHNAELQKVRQNLEQAQSRQTSAEAALVADEEKVATLNRELKRSQDLNASLAEAHELIVDRNVHVLNVFPEVDGNSKSPQPRGRIFYAEGKKLVFYAYDLNDAGKISAKASFYLWGEGPGIQQLVGLGKFQIDSEQQGRWVLRVTDPKLLANLSSVFVTLEPDKQAVTKPTGKRMLSRLLHSTTDNH
jgi:hypothetical protein